MSSDKRRTRIGAYELDRTLGEGTFGKVRLGHNTVTKEKVAIKVVHHDRAKNGSERVLVERERFALSRLHHPHIVKLHEIIDDPSSMRYYIVVEYVGGGELFDYIVSRGRLKEKDSRKFIRQVVSALDYCHAHLIIHRDLKPENVLLDENLNVKITDFGLSNIIRPGEKFKTFCGSLHYACPEILRGEAYHGPSADIWSLGVILYCLVTGSQPWNAPTSEDILLQILETGLHFPAWITPACIDLLTRMLCLTEKNRITLEEIKKHPWILKGYDEPPPSYLPPMPPINSIDNSVMHKLTLMGYVDTYQTRQRITQGGIGNVITSYHSLLNQQKDTMLTPQSTLFSIQNERVSSSRTCCLPHPSNLCVCSQKLLKTHSTEPFKTSTDDALTICVSGSSLSTTHNNPELARTPPPLATDHPSECKPQLFDRIKLPFIKRSLWQFLLQGFHPTSRDSHQSSDNAPQAKESAHQPIEKLSLLDLENISLLIQKKRGKCPRIRRCPPLSKQYSTNEPAPNISDLFALPPSDLVPTYRAREWVSINIHFLWQNKSTVSLEHF